MAKTIIGTFPGKVEADRAVDDLLHYGYRNDEILVISKDGSEFEYHHPEDGTVGSSRLTGFLTGIFAGGILGALAGFGAYFIPGAVEYGINNFLGFEGMSGMILLGAVTGALIGGVIGFVGSARNESNIKKIAFKNGYNYGQVLIAVPSSDIEESDVKDILKSYGAQSLQSVDLNEYVEAEYRSKYEQPMGYAGVKGGRRTND